MPAAQTQGKGSTVPPLLQANAPGAANAGQAALPVYPQNGGAAGETVTDENGTYAVTRHLTHLEEGPGRVRRITAAVIVNDRLTTEGSGKQAHTVWKPRTADEMQRIQQLARAAVGYDATRGDEITVQNIGFSSNQPEAAPTAMGKVMDEADGVLHTQPGLLRTLSFSLIALLVVLVVLKPVSRQITAALKQTPVASLPAAAGGANAEMLYGSAVPLGALSSGLPRTETQALYRQIAEQVRKEPEQSVRVIESWINARGEEAL
jgi:flagellar M-ring protein FliF